MENIIEKTIHIGPVFDGGMGSVIQGYIKLFGLPKENAWNTYKNSFVKSIPFLFAICFKILFRKNKDIVCYHLHTASNGSLLRKFIIGACLKLKSKKFVIHLHGAGFPKYFSQNISTIILIKIISKMSGNIICMRKDWKELIEKGKLKCDIFVIPNFCETIAENPIDLENRSKEIRIVYAGRYGKRKGVYDLLAAFEKANFTNLVHLDLYGDGEVEKVKEMVNRSSKKQLITVNGWIEHKEYIKKLPQYDFFVLPSYAENFSMALMEPMGLGIPVISTFTGAAPEIVKNNETGLLINAGDISAFAKAMEKLASDKNLRTKLSKNAWVNVRENLSPQVVLGKLEDMYGKL